MNANQIIRMLTRLARANARNRGSGAARTPEEKARQQQKRQQMKGLRIGARLLRMFGRY